MIERMSLNETSDTEKKNSENPILYSFASLIFETPSLLCGTMVRYSLFISILLYIIMIIIIILRSNLDHTNNLRSSN